jgi:hypothetical protein
MARLSFEELQALLGLTQHAGGSADFGHDETENGNG